MNGAVDAWSADLLGAVQIPSGQYLEALDTHAITTSGDKVLVGGHFCSETVTSSGGSGFSGYLTCTSPLLIFAASSGALLRPTDAAATAWFPVGTGTTAYAIDALSGGVVVALGRLGVAVFDPTTLDFDAVASAPLTNWYRWGTDPQCGVFALSTPIEPPAAPSVSGMSVRVATAVLPPTRLVIAGSMPSWGNHLAGNLVTADPFADGVAPTATAPAATPRTGVALSGTSIPVTVAWASADNAGGSGVARYELARSTNGGTTWTMVSSSLAAASYASTVPSSGTVRFRVRAVDKAGNVGAWMTGPTLTPRLIQQSSSSVRYRGTWTSTSSSHCSGGSERYARTPGASATYSFTGRSITFVTTTAPTRGKVKVYVNGTLVATVDLRSSSTRYRIVAWQKTWSTSASRTVKLVVVGTSGRPRVDLDAFVTLR